MAVSRKSRRFNPLVLSLIVLAVVVLVVVGVLAIRSWTRAPAPNPKEAQRQRVAQRVQQIIEGLDVLIVSHYTAETVQAGQVRLPGEYQAARQNLQQLNQWFKDIQPDLEAQQAVEIERALTTLQEMVERKQPASAVREQAEALTKMLRQVGR
jgi:predicted metallo-beta-lactamase superfamily hydrolase